MIALAPILGVAGAALGFMGQSSKDQAAKKAAEEANRIAKEKADAEFLRAQQEYELSWQTNLTNYYWEQAQTEQIRQVEAQKAADQATAGSRMIWGAIEAYNVNSQSLYAKFVTQEALRSQSEGMQYQQQMSQLGLKNALITNDARQAVNGYLASVLTNGVKAQGEVAGAESKVDELITSLASKEMQANYEYNAKVITAAMDASIQGNDALTRSGGGNSAKAQAMNATKRALMDYAQVHIGRQARTAQVGQINKWMTGEVSRTLSALATQSANYEIQAGLAIGKANTQLKSNASEAAFTTAVFDKLTIPSFKIANDQYARELRGLQLGVMDQLYNATLPYRQQEVFDPLYPIKGIAPTYYAPSPVQAQTGGFFGMANAALSGAQSFAPTLFTDIIPNALSNIKIA